MLALTRDCEYCEHYDKDNLACMHSHYKTFDIDIRECENISCECLNFTETEECEDYRYGSQSPRPHGRGLSREA